MNFTEARSEAKRLKQAYLAYSKAEEVLVKALDAEQTVRNLNDEIAKSNKELTALSSKVAQATAQHEGLMVQHQTELEEVLANNKLAMEEVLTEYEKLGGNLALDYKTKVEANAKALDEKETALNEVEAKYASMVEALAEVRAARSALLEKLGG